MGNLCVRPLSQWRETCETSRAGGQELHFTWNCQKKLKEYSMHNKIKNLLCTNFCNVRVGYGMGVVTARGGVSIWSGVMVRGLFYINLLLFLSTTFVVLF